MTDETTTEGTETPQSEAETASFSSILAERDASQPGDDTRDDETKEEAEGDVEQATEETPSETEEENPEAEDAPLEDDEEPTDEAPGEEKSFDESDVVGSAQKALADAGFGKLAEQLVSNYSAVSNVAEGVHAVYESEERAREDIPGFVRELALHHGLSVAELLGEELTAELEEPPFASEMERRTWRELQELKRERAAEKRERDQQAQKDRAEAILKSHAKEIAPGVQLTLGKRYDGFKVTVEQVESALRELPQYRDRPAKAVEMMYARQIAQHMGRRREANKEKPSQELGRSRDVGGVQLPDDPTKIKFSDVLAAQRS